MDGTLTPPRLPMTEDFADTFVPWLAHHKAFIATGSDFAKVMEQLPDSVINAFSGIYCAMGNQLRQGHEIVYQKDFKLSDDLREDLERFRAKILYLWATEPFLVVTTTNLRWLSLYWRIPKRFRYLVPKLLSMN